MSRRALQAQPYSALVLADAPLLYYRLGEAAGASAAQDASGNGLTGTYLSGAHPGAPGGLGGDADTGCYLDGTTTAQIVCPSSVLLNQPSFTVEFLIKVLDNTGGPVILTKGFANWRMYIGSDWAVKADSASGTNTVQSDIGGSYPITLLTRNVWAHVVLTFAGTATVTTNGVMTLWVNGVKCAQVTGIVSTINAAGSLNFGSSGVTAPIAFIDECAFYSFVLSDARIAAHAGARFLPTARRVVV